MKSTNAIQLLAAASVAALLNGCGEEKMLEVNDINCQRETILKIEDKAMQQEFASKCFRRINYKPSNGKEW